MRGNMPLCCYDHAMLGACTAALSAGLQRLPASSAISAPHPVTATGNTLSPRCLLPVPTLQHKHMEEGPGARSLGQSLDNSKSLQPGSKSCYQVSMPTTGPFEA